VSSLRIVLLSSVCLTLAACDRYLEERYLVRRDTVTSSAGDAVASNSAVQIPTPWPRYSNDTNIAFDGAKIGCAVQRYREEREFPPTGSQQGSSGSGVAVSGGSGSQQSSPAGSGCLPLNGAAATGAGAGTAAGPPPGQGYGAGAAAGP